MFTTLISAAELCDQQDVRLIDARSGPDARARYGTEHLAGALFVDLDADLANIGDPKVGGRHPLPTPQAFSALLGRLGIRPGQQVVVYDDKNGANAAARFWWMLKTLGHDAVAVLDGGYAAALRAGFPRTHEPTLVEPTNYPVAARQNFAAPHQVATMSDVDAARQDPKQRVIDVRERARYLGEVEAIDPIAGHIPGAINIPFAENLAPDGTFLARGALRAKYEKELSGFLPAKAIVHCGSGVTACHTLLAIAHAGLPMPRLYVGSYSEWARNHAIARGEESR